MFRVIKVAMILTAFLAQPALASSLGSSVAERLGPNRVRVEWLGTNSVDIFVSKYPDATISKATRIGEAESGGVYDVTPAFSSRPYFILRDVQTGAEVRVAERLLPLQHGSNFRDVGGYIAAGGKHVRWGLIYRSSEDPDLTKVDFNYIESLGIKADVDLRATDELVVWPDLVPHYTEARYIYHKYMFKQVITSTYADLLTLLAPQLRAMFHQMLRGEGPILIHCGVGQDRTGVAIALVLSALGVPRDVITQDYLLSTKYRVPQYESSTPDAAKYPGNYAVQFLAKLSPSDELAPLYDAFGNPYLQETFDRIDRHWGGLRNYLEQELGVSPADVARLRALYLE